MDPPIWAGDERRGSIWHDDAPEGDGLVEAMRVEEPLIIGEARQQSGAGAWCLGQAEHLNGEQRGRVALCRADRLGAPDQRLDARVTLSRLGHSSSAVRIAALNERDGPGHESDN